MTQSIRRAVNVLFLVAKNGSGQSLTEIAAASGMSKATAFRLLRTLREENLLRHDRVRRRYFPGNGLFQIASLLDHSEPLREIALPHMQDLREQTRETISLVVPEGMERVTVEALPSFHELRLVPAIHSRRPIYLGAPGKVLLAFRSMREIDRVIAETGLKPWTSASISSRKPLLKDLANIRQRGYATSVEETSEGGAATAAPIFDSRNEVIAALNVFGPVFRMTPKLLKRLGALTAVAAARISKDLGASSGASDRRVA